MGDGRGKKDHRKCHAGENAVLRERCFPGKTGGDQAAGEQSALNAVEDIQEDTVQRQRKIQRGKLPEGIAPECFLFEKDRNRAVPLRGAGMEKKQAGDQKEAGKELPGGSTECGDGGRGEIFGETEKPGEVGSTHAHKLFQKLAKRRQCRLILAEIPRRKAVVNAGGHNAERENPQKKNGPRLKKKPAADEIRTEKEKD